MKDIKISPEDYSKIISALNINEISLIESNFSIKEVNNPGGHISLNLKDKYDFVDSSEEVSFFGALTLNGELESSTGTTPFFTIKAKFKFLYKKSEPIEITKDFLAIFKEISLSVTAWPYFREHVQGLISKASLPPLVLPLRKVSTNE